jgi:hypothetical protein
MEKGEERREKGGRSKEKGEGRRRGEREKGERRKEKEERRREGCFAFFFNFFLVPCSQGTSRKSTNSSDGGGRGLGSA